MVNLNRPVCNSYCSWIVDLVLDKRAFATLSYPKWCVSRFQDMSFTQVEFSPVANRNNSKERQRSAKKMNWDESIYQLSLSSFHFKKYSKSLHIIWTSPEPLLWKPCNCRGTKRKTLAQSDIFDRVLCLQYPFPVIGSALDSRELPFRTPLWKLADLNHQHPLHPGKLLNLTETLFPLPPTWASQSLPVFILVYVWNERVNWPPSLGFQFQKRIRHIPSHTTEEYLQLPGEIQGSRKIKAQRKRGKRTCTYSLKR